jgi:fibronectin-binding autotransporter adhesin
MATLQSTTFNDTGNITMPVGNTGQRPSPTLGMMRFNTSMNLLEWYNGSTWQPVTGISAGTIGTGGQSIEFRNGGIVHQFTSVGSHTFTPAFTGTVQVLVVAGGGGGAGSHGGGGGAGGVIFNRSVPVSSGTPIAVTVGAAGESRPYGSFAQPGGNSVFGGITANGGGGGGPWDNASQAGPGGSGGGAGSSSADGSRYVVLGGFGTQGQGFPGGSGRRFNRQGDNQHGSGGGGGSGGEGSTHSDDRYEHFTADGGPGSATDILGEILYFGGGGGSGPHVNPGGGGAGGIGGGGGGGCHHGSPLRPSNPSFNQGLGGGRALNTGQPAPSQTTGGNAGANTGGGGGGGNSGSPTQQIGGSGIVVVRY